MRRLRVLSAPLFFIPALLAFVDFGLVLPAGAAGLLARTQLVPSLLRSFVVPMAILPLGLVALSTLLFGRVYCSTLCPLGTVQDGAIRLAVGDPCGRRQRRGRLVAPPLALHLMGRWRGRRAIDRAAASSSSPHRRLCVKTSQLLPAFGASPTS